MTSAQNFKPCDDLQVGTSDDPARSIPARLVTGDDFYFEVRRDDEVSVTSILFCGGAWRWHLCDADGRAIATSEGHSTEPACRKALAAVRAHAGSALQSKR